MSDKVTEEYNVQLEKEIVRRGLLIGKSYGNRGFLFSLYFDSLEDKIEIEEIGFYIDYSGRRRVNKTFGRVIGNVGIEKSIKYYYIYDDVFSEFDKKLIVYLLCGIITEVPEDSEKVEEYLMNLLTNLYLSTERPLDINIVAKELKNSLQDLDDIIYSIVLLAPNYDGKLAIAGLSRNETYISDFIIAGTIELLNYCVENGFDNRLQSVSEKNIFNEIKNLRNSIKRKYKVSNVIVEGYTYIVDSNNLTFEISPIDLD